MESSIFDEPEPEPQPTDSQPNPAAVEEEEEAEGEEEDEAASEDEIDTDGDDSDADSDDELETAPEAEGVGGFRTAVEVWITLSKSLAFYCVRFDDSSSVERTKHGTNTQNACRKWSEAVRAHHPTVMHFYMHQGGAHVLEAYEVCGEPDQTCDTLVELGNHRAGRIKSRISWMTKAAVPDDEMWEQNKEWLEYEYIQEYWLEYWGY